MRQDVIEEKVNTLERRANNHSERIRVLESNNAANTVEIKNLCKSIKGLAIAFYTLAGSILCALAAFFFYAVRAGLF